ncbi:MAG: response regulator transcription factor [Niastella sp.]|nr:response regulator transcription factor [Niastella sp.]
MARKITCIITDDEPMARKGLQGYVEKIDFLELVGACEDAVQLNSLLKQGPVDLLFLDIEMPYITGIDFLQQATNPPKVVFTTAYEQYAIKGYELDVLDYLLKPISFERFLKAANKAYDYFAETPAADQRYLFIKTDTRLEKIYFQDILFVEAMENYVAVYTAEKKHITHSTLKGLQERLPAAAFIQPHKSYLVNVEAIGAVEGNILHLGRYQVPVSKYLREEVMERIGYRK